MAKTHTLIIRGVSKDQKNSLKRLAKARDKRASVNSLMLQVIEDKTVKEIETFQINKNK